MVASFADGSSSGSDDEAGADELSASDWDVPGGHSKGPHRRPIIESDEESLDLA